MEWITDSPDDKMLMSWIENEYNVLFHGRHGVGKTSLVFSAFEKMGWKINKDFLYFSASTIDPWVDLVGVPSKINKDGHDVLELVRPAHMINSEIKAFFVDEFNRSHKKVRNALMELIQFKSINGLKFPQLKVVWAAVNPDDDKDLKFDVENLDPAQEDRFHIHIQIPYKPSKKYFAKRFKDQDLAEGLCKWWDSQPDDVKLKISPRRLEYAVDAYFKTNELRYSLPINANIAALKQAIVSGNVEKKLQALISAGDVNETRKWISIENNFNGCKKLISENKVIMKNVLPLLSEEKVVSLLSSNKSIEEEIINNPKFYMKLIENLAKNSPNKKIKQTFQKILSEGSSDKQSQIIEEADRFLAIPEEHYAKSNLDSLASLECKTIVKNKKITLERLHLLNSYLYSSISNTDKFENLITSASMLQFTSSKSDLEKIVSEIDLLKNSCYNINEIVLMIKIIQFVIYARPDAKDIEVLKNIAVDLYAEWSYLTIENRIEVSQNYYNYSQIYDVKYNPTERESRKKRFITSFPIFSDNFILSSNVF